MKKIQLITFVLLVLVGSTSLQAQQRSIYSQYMFNGLAINPAYSAIEDVANISLHYRQQWVGMDGAPKTGTLSFYTPTNVSTLSIGAMATADKIGINTQGGLNFSAAIKAQLSDEIYLAAGLNLGVEYLYSDLPSLPTTWDPLFAGAEKDLNGVVGAGLMLFSKDFYLGVSAPQLQNLSFKEENNGNTESKFLRHYYVSGGYLFGISPNFKLKPNFLLRFSDRSNFQYDVNLSAYLFNRFWLGASWRTQESINALVKFEITPQFELAYSYDILTAASSKVASGSHEIMLSYRFMVQRQRVMPVKSWI